MVGSIESCPHCGEVYGSNFLGFNDGLGAQEFLCLKCKQPFGSGRMEWAEMGFLGQLRLVLVTFLLPLSFSCQNPCPVPPPSGIISVRSGPCVSWEPTAGLVLCPVALLRRRCRVPGPFPIVHRGTSG